jgi:RNA polymerase sigma factor (sigma-70 family)
MGEKQVPERARYGDAFEPLIEAAKTGAPWAWERLYCWLSPVVVGYLRSQGVREADDLASEVWVGVLRNIDRFTGDDAQFRSWVFVIAHRRLQDERRRLVRRPESESTDETESTGFPAGDDTAEAALGRVAAERVREFCDQLPADQRDVVLLRTVADLTVEQVAAVLGRSPGAVKALQRRGFTRLRRLVESEGVPL